MLLLKAFDLSSVIKHSYTFVPKEEMSTSRPFELFVIFSVKIFDTPTHISIAAYLLPNSIISLTHFQY